MKKAESENMPYRRRQVLCDQKWRGFLRKGALFRHIPFIEFVFGSGSLALGNVHKNSDYDVLIGVKQGRIFTARFFSILLFGALGWRRKRLSHQESASNKICLNHFVTEKSFALQPPYDDSWRLLYRHLVPLLGIPARLESFLKANESWVGAAPEYRSDLRHRFKLKSVLANFAERCLGGQLGNGLESILKNIQVRRIEKSLRSGEVGGPSRIQYTDQELEFHPDARARYQPH